MKRIKSLIFVLWSTILLTSCQGNEVFSSRSVSDMVWEKAVSDSDIRAYVNKHMNEIDMEALENEAGNDSLSLKQQFRATVLLCEMEYQNYMNDMGQSVPVYKEGVPLNGVIYTYSNGIEIANAEDMFAADYPVSAAYASRYLAKVDIAGDEFWKSIEVAKYPYNYFQNLLAAADSISGETLAKWITDCPETYYSLKKDIASAINTWLAEKPERLVDTGEQLAQTDYFKEKEGYELSRIFFGTSKEPIQIEGVDQGLSYLQFVKTTVFPFLDENYPDYYEKQHVYSELLENNYYSTHLNITVEDSLDLKEGGTESETIELEGKKVIAFYRSPKNTEFPDAPGPLRMIGDFMMSLPDDQFAATLAEANYYLVLEADYVPGDFYDMGSSTSIEIQQVFSFTSIDLYEAATGTRIRHIGTVKESPSEFVYTLSNDNTPRWQYPEVISAEKLLFMYWNMNEAESFQHMLTPYTADQTSLRVTDTARIGSWELVLNSYEVIESFEDGLYLYTAEDGHKYLRCEFTITNHSNEETRLFPILFYLDRDLRVEINDEDGNVYTPLQGVSTARYFEGSTFAPGECITRYMLFEIPDSLVNSEQPIGIELSIRPQKAVFLLD